MIIEYIVVLGSGMALAAVFMEVRMTLFARLAALEAMAKTLIDGAAAKAEAAAGDVAHAVETVGVDAFDEVKATVDSLVQDVAALKLMIGTETDTPTPTAAPAPIPAPAAAEPIGPAATEVTGTAPADPEPAAAS